MNANELEVNSGSVKLGNEVIKTSKITHDAEKQVLTVALEKEVAAGSTVTLSLVFTGSINDGMSGFYRSAYTDAQGNKQYLGVTQFEATDARKAFPCWDEPALKATFSITLNVRKKYTALCNMNVVSETTDPSDADRKIVVFAKTPIMSTYLIAWAVGELEYIEDKTKEGVVVRVYTLIGDSKQGKFALHVGKETVCCSVVSVPLTNPT